MNPALEKRLEKLNVEGLLEVKEKVDYLLKHRKEDEKEKLMEEFKQMALASGLSLDKIVWDENAQGTFSPSGERKRPKKQYKPKFEDPNNPENKWTGLGKTPRWVTAYLEANPGSSREDLRIPEVESEADDSAATEA